MMKNGQPKKIFVAICIFLTSLILLVSLLKHFKEKQNLAMMIIQKNNTAKAISSIDNIVNNPFSNKKDSPFTNSKNLSYLKKVKEKAPLNSFNVLYFDTRQQHILAESIVQDIDVSYSWSNKYNTPSEDFGAYWVGRLNFSKDASKIIDINLSRSTVQLIIDNKLIFEGNDNIKIPFFFSKGEHLIEVKYFNNWHTTDFSLSLKPASYFSQDSLSQEPLSIPIVKRPRHFPQYNRDANEVNIDIGDIPEKYKINLPKIVFVSIYNTESPDSEVTVVLDKVPSPIIIILNAAYPVKWNVKNPSNNDIVKIIYSQQTIVSLESSKVVPRESQRLKDLGYHRDGELSCHCSDGYFHCEYQPLLPLINSIQIKTNTLVYGYTFERNASTLLVPKVIFENNVTKLTKQLSNYRAQLSQCTATVNPNFELMVDET